MDYNYFIEAATGDGKDSKETRRLLADCFADVSTKIDCLHCPADPLHMADDALRNQSLDGPIVEFGCFQGGMSCKLSKVASILGRKMMIFDSFAGLRENDTYETFPTIPQMLGTFRKGQFACGRDVVEENLRLHGAHEVCELIEGPIEQTIQQAEIEPSLVFIDVDIVSTALCVIKKMWPRIQNRKLFTHEACIKGYMEQVCDKNWWWLFFRTEVPRLGSEEWGTEFGLPGSVCLNYFLKP